MLRLFSLAVLLCLAAFAANVRLYLQDGSYQIVREYQVQSDRVRFYSVERSQWEEIPLTLVDLKRTEAEIKERQTALEEETKTIAAEDAFERQQREEIARVPMEPGVYLVAGGELKPVKQAESKIVTSKRRSVLKILSPVPMVSGKATVELDGEHSENVVAVALPEFYFRLAADERFGILRLTPKKDTRVVEKWSIAPITKEIYQEQEQVEIFRRQLGERLYKIWPREPLPPGEYAVVEYTEGQPNIQVWDFSYGPAAQP
jgi:hypothetical protein